MTTEDPTPFEQLRKPFPKGVVGKLPKGGVMLDFVGHAAVTDRLLTVDPEWTWEPLALDAQGLPALDQAGNLWIRLTVAGVTRIGVGDGKSMKERIGDAIRNAAMRFGVALDLWTKDELESGHAEEKRRPGRPVVPDAPQHDPNGWPPVTETGELINDAQMRKMRATLADLDITEPTAARNTIASLVGHPLASAKDLTRAEASRVIDALVKLTEEIS